MKHYKKQVDPSSTKIIWSRIKCIKFPSGLEKISSKLWSFDDLQQIEDNLPSIRFFPDPGKVAIHRVQKRQEVLDNRQQVNPDAKYIPWKNVVISGAPFRLNRDVLSLSSFEELQAIESCLNTVIFENFAAYKGSKLKRKVEEVSAQHLVDDEYFSLMKTALDEDEHRIFI